MPTRPESSGVSKRATTSQDTQASPWLAHFAAAVQATPRTSERSRARASTGVADCVDSLKPATSRTGYNSKQERDQPDVARLIPRQRPASDLPVRECRDRATPQAGPEVHTA